MLLRDDSPYFSDEHRMIREQIRRFVAERVIPHGDAWEEAGCIPRDVFREMGELGLFGMRIPTEYGGSGLDTMASVVLGEELGQSTFGGLTGSVLAHTDMAVPHLTRFGTPEQKEKFLPGIIAGTTIGAITVTEPDAGSDTARLRTRAVRDGDHYVLNGAKTFITNGVHGDLLFTAVRTDPDARWSRGLSMFIVERQRPGVRVSRALKKTGWLCSDTAEIVFEDCCVPVSHRLGDENKGFYSMMANFQTERIAIAAAAVGEATKALELTLAHVRGRKAFDATLWDREVIRQRLAMHASKVEAARQLTHYTAWLDAQGMDCVREVSMLKAHACEVAQAVMYDCVQFHGGMGYMRETPVERMSRDCRVWTIGGGATEVMLEEVAKRL